MKPAPENSCDGEDVASKAAQWVLRCDRGLTAAEQDELSAWLAQSPRHRAALGEHRWGWDELDRLAGMQTTVGAVPDPDLLAPCRTGTVAFLRSATWGAAVLAAAAAIVFAMWWRPAAVPAAGVTIAKTTAVQSNLVPPCERRTLEDGSVIELNRGAVVEVTFSATARNIRLTHGEAHFVVAKDPVRPFIVDAGGVVVRAIGTQFNVRLDPAAVEVLVTEGVVDVAPQASKVRESSTVPIPVKASQRAVVARDSDAMPEVTTLTAQQVGARLAWQPRLLDFTDATLLEIVEQFNAHNDVKLVVADPTLGGTRLSATFRSDNVEGFVRLMESDFGMRSDWRGPREIALSRAR
jgi:transmembrane sensor